MAKNCSFVVFEVGVGLFDENLENLILSKRFENPILSNTDIVNGDFSNFFDLIDKMREYDTIYCNLESIVFYLRNFGLNSFLLKESQLEKLDELKIPFIVKLNFAKDEREAYKILRDFAIQLSSTKVKTTSEQLDLHIIQAINALDELDKIINTIGTRMREWYGLHFPELDHLIQNIVTYAEIIRIAGCRTNLTKDILEKLGFDERRSEIIYDASRRSRGGDIIQENLVIVKKLADEIIIQSELRKILANHIENSMEKIAPNVKELLTATVGARLIAKAGGLGKLSVLPASTIQILGAEKALFRSLKTGASPPKHGILFQQPILHSAPRWQRGKIARTIASKVAIASRIDVYRNGEKDYSIVDSMNSRIAEIQEKYKEPRPEQQIRDKNQFTHSNRPSRSGRERRYYHRSGSHRGYESSNKFNKRRNNKKGKHKRSF